MKGLSQSKNAGNRFRSHVAKLMLGGAVSCLLAAPAAAQGYASPASWSGPYVAIGLGVIDMNADARVNAARKDAVDLDIDCPTNVDDPSNGDTPVQACTFNGGDLVFTLEGGNSLQASLRALQQQLLNLEDLSDRGVMGVLSLGWDHRLAGSNWLIGGFVNGELYNVESEFSSPGQGAKQFSFTLDGELEIEENGTENENNLAAAIIGEAIANGLGEKRISIDGKIEQDYAIQVGGRLGHIWNENFMTYVGAAWMRTSIDGHVNVNIADPICGAEGLCDGSNNSPTQIRLNLDEDVDGYKLLVGGEYALGSAMGGSWFLRGEASWSDFDGLSKAFFGSKSQTLVSQEGDQNELQCEAKVCDPSIDITRLINESASVQIDKEDLAVHAALLYKFGSGQ